MEPDKNYYLYEIGKKKHVFSDEAYHDIFGNLSHKDKEYPINSFTLHHFKLSDKANDLFFLYNEKNDMILHYGKSETLSSFLIDHGVKYKKINFVSHKFNNRTKLTGKYDDRTVIKLEVRSYNDGYFLQAKRHSRGPYKIEDIFEIYLPKSIKSFKEIESTIASLTWSGKAEKDQWPEPIQELLKEEKDKSDSGCFITIMIIILIFILYIWISY